MDKKQYSCVKVLPPNEYGNAFVQAGVVMYTAVEENYENPNIEECGKQVLDDFSNKILTIFKENLYGVNHPQAEDLWACHEQLSP